MIKSKNPVYSGFFANISWLENLVKKTPWNGKTSDNSFSLIGEKDKYKTLCDVFGFDIPIDKFNEAMSGDGSEYKRITILHSSSLAALLFFSNISKNNPLNIELEGVQYDFYDVHFECRTVVSGSHKSNMDVVLIGNTVECEKVVLFLECKLSEYLKSGKCSEISSDVYKDLYQELGLFNTGTIREMVAKEIDDVSFDLIPTANFQYCSGIKQMISHYMGISNFINDNFISKNDGDFSLDFTPDKIFLAEILFRFPKEVDNRGRLGHYEKSYHDLAKVINAHNKNSKFHMVTESLTYEKVFKNHKLNNKIKDYYQL